MLKRGCERWGNFDTFLGTYEKRSRLKDSCFVCGKGDSFMKSEITKVRF